MPLSTPTSSGGSISGDSFQCTTTNGRGAVALPFALISGKLPLTNFSIDDAGLNKVLTCQNDGSYQIAISYSSSSVFAVAESQLRTPIFNGDFPFATLDINVRNLASVVQPSINFTSVEKNMLVKTSEIPVPADPNYYLQMQTMILYYDMLAGFTIEGNVIQQTTQAINKQLVLNLDILKLS